MGPLIKCLDLFFVSAEGPEPPLLYLPSYYQFIQLCIYSQTFFGRQGELTCSPSVDLLHKVPVYFFSSADLPLLCPL